MKAHLKTKTGTTELIQRLKEFCGNNFKYEDYKVFSEVEVDTKYDTDIAAFITEDVYMSGNYGIRLFKRSNHNEDLFIPLEFIDCIYCLWNKAKRRTIKLVDRATGGISKIRNANLNTWNVKGEQNESR